MAAEPTELPAAAGFAQPPPPADTSTSFDLAKEQPAETQPELSEPGLRELAGDKEVQARPRDCNFLRKSSTCFPCRPTNHLAFGPMATL